MGCYGISCWPWGDQSACRNTIEERRLEGHESFMERAGREGWRIGHWDGQAYYVCPDHRDAVWDATRLKGMLTWRCFAQKMRLNRRLHRNVVRASRLTRKGAFRKFKHVDRHGLNYLTKHPKFWKGWAQLRQDRRRRERDA